MFEEPRSSSRSLAVLSRVRNSNEYGSLRICWVRSESGAGRVRAKLVRAFPSLSRSYS